VKQEGEVCRCSACVHNASFVVFRQAKQEAKTKKQEAREQEFIPPTVRLHGVLTLFPHQSRIARCMFAPIPNQRVFHPLCVFRSLLFSRNLLPGLRPAAVAPRPRHQAHSTCRHSRRNSVTNRFAHLLAPGFVLAAVHFASCIRTGPNHISTVCICGCDAGLPDP
jgi:hypothetical protein